MILNIFGINYLLIENMTTEFIVGRYWKGFTETRLQGLDSTVDLNIS